MLSEDFNLDIGAAEQQIDLIGAKLTQVAQEFQVSLADALSVLDQPLSIQLDASSVETQISDAAAAADPVIEPVVDVASVESEIAQINGQLDLFADVDLSAVEADIAGEQLSLFIDADTSPAQAEIGALSAEVPPIEIPVEADTSAAQDEIASLKDQVSGLGDSLSGAGGGLSLLGENASAFGVAAGLAGREAGGLGGALKSIAPGATGAVAAVAAITAATGGFFEQAVAFEGGVQRLNTTFGDFAGQLETINVGSLNKDLVELDTELGSSTTQVRNAVSSFGNLGLASGQTQAQVAGASEQLVALAARAVALNPAIGSVGDAVTGLSKGLARGGRFAAQYGVALTSAEINARALQDNVGKTADQLTIYDKAAAGAALATERYGASLDETINKGADNPILKVKALEQEFKNLTTALGEPLVVPVLELLTQAEPIFGVFATLLADLGRGLTPIASAFVSLVGTITGILGPAIADLGPSFQAFGEAIGGVIDQLQPLAALLGELASGFLSGLSDALQGFAFVLSQPVVKGLIAAAIAVTALTVAFQVLSVLAVTNPIGLIAVSLIALLGALGGVKDKTDAFKQFSEDVKAAGGAVDKAFFNNATSIDDLGAAMKGFSDNEFADFITKQSEFAKTPELLSGLKDSGVAIQQLRTDLTEGSQGLNDFATALIRSGQIELKVNGVKQVVNDFNDLTDAQKNLLVNNSPLLQAFNRQQAAVEQVSKAKIDALVFSGALTQDAVNQAIEFDKAAGAGDGYATALERLAQISPEAARQQQALAAGIQLSVDPAGKNAQKFLDLANAINNGIISTDNFKTAFGDIQGTFGVTEDQLGTFVKAVEDQIDALVKAAESKLPTVNDALQSVGEAADPSKLIENLKTQVDEIGVFTEAVRFLLAGGFNDVAQFLVEQGPKVGAQYVKALQAAGPATVQALETNLEKQKAAVQGADQAIRTEFVPQFEQTGGLLGAAQAQGIAQGADFQAALQPKLNSLIQTIENDPQLQAAAQNLGVNLNQIFSEGIDLRTATDPKLVALRDKLLTDPDVRAAAAQLGIDVTQAFSGTADFSPSLDPALAAVQLKLLTNPEIRAAAAALGIDLAAALSNNADFVTSTDPKIVALREFIATQGDPNDPNTPAGAAKEHLGGGVVSGYIQGLAEGQGPMDSATANAALHAVFAAAGPQGIDSGSPSRVAARVIGLPVSQGIAQGIDQGATDIDTSLAAALAPITDTTLPDVVREAEAILAGANLALPPITPPTLPGIPAVAATGGTVITIGTIAVQVTAGPGVTTDQAAAVGAAVGDAVVAQVESRTNAQITMRGA